MKCFHGDFLYRAAHRAKSAADAARFVFYHHCSGKRSYSQLLWRYPAQFDVIGAFVLLQMGKYWLGKFKVLKRDQLKALLGADINAAATKNAFAAINFSAFKN